MIGWCVLNPNSRVFTGALSGCKVDRVNGPDGAFTGACGAGHAPTNGQGP